MRFLTSGESHGEALYGIIEGLPSGLKIDLDAVNNMLKRRQQVLGRGDRSKNIDTAQVVTGLYNGVTTGAPITVIIRNHGCGDKGNFDFFRPGHVDYAAYNKYGYDNPALGAERASARETAMRTALGAIAVQLLDRLGIKIVSYVYQIGKSVTNDSSLDIFNREIQLAAAENDTLGGKLGLKISGVTVGIGSHAFYDRKLSYRLAGALMSIPSVKAVENGLGTGFADLRGSEAMDIMRCVDGQIKRFSNNCGGLEGGISNGEDIEFLLTLKPVPSVPGIKTIDKNYNNCVTEKVRGDVCAVFAACVVAEAVVALELTSAVLDCMGGDTMDELICRYSAKGAPCKR